MIAVYFLIGVFVVIRFWWHLGSPKTWSDFTAMFLIVLAWPLVVVMALERHLAYEAAENAADSPVKP